MKAQFQSAMDSVADIISDLEELRDAESEPTKRGTLDARLSNVEDAFIALLRSIEGGFSEDDEGLVASFRSRRGSHRAHENPAHK